MVYSESHKSSLLCPCGAASVSWLGFLLPSPRRFLQNEEAFRAKMRLVLNEWVAATVQLHFGKATPENDDKFYAFLRQAVPLEAVFGKEALEIDPLERLHPLELKGGRDGRGFPGDFTSWLGAWRFSSSLELYWQKLHAWFFNLSWLLFRSASLCCCFERECCFYASLGVAGPQISVAQIVCCSYRTRCPTKIRKHPTYFTDIGTSANIDK